MIAPYSLLTFPPAVNSSPAQTSVRITQVRGHETTQHQPELDLCQTASYIALQTWSPCRNH